MVEVILAGPPRTSTQGEPGVAELIRDRTERGLLFFEEFGGEFVEVAPGIVRVPSRSGAGLYDVDAEREECSCPDFEYRTSRHGVGCCHVFGVAIARARRAAIRRARQCAGCGGRFRAHDLDEVEEEDESLTFFPGDALCEPCAIAHGVA